MTVALSSFGYWRTLSVRIAWMPAMMMMRLTTIASTGRRMKMSVSFIGASAIVAGSGSSFGIELLRVVDHDRRAVAELEGAGA